MTPINNSDLAWLVTADYNQDHNIPFAEELREDIYNPDVNDWVDREYTAYDMIEYKKVGSRHHLGVGSAGFSRIVTEQNGGGVGFGEIPTLGQSVGWDSPCCNVGDYWLS